MKATNQIDGWFWHENVFDLLVSSIPDGGIFVECGAWLGKSSSYLCDIAKDRILVYIVDTWKGSASEIDTNHAIVKSQDVYKLFIENMGDRKFIPIISDGAEAAKQFNDNSCDVVFIDMEHTYEAVKRDITAWLPKVKVGGYISGHDYHYPWPEVINAVDEMFDKNKLQVLNTCWIYKKE